MCEAKPRNFDTEAIERFERGERKSKPSKLNGGGNFTDYTFEKLERHRKEKDLNMLVSGFVDGKLIYILEFPFNYLKFVEHLEEQLQHRFPKGKDIAGQFLRSANFYYKHYFNCPELKVVYLLEKDKLQRYEPYIVRNFYKFLWKKAK